MEARTRETEYPGGRRDRHCFGVRELWWSPAGCPGAQVLGSPGILVSRCYGLQILLSSGHLKIRSSGDLENGTLGTGNLETRKSGDPSGEECNREDRDRGRRS